MVKKDQLRNNQVGLAKTQAEFNLDDPTLRTEGGAANPTGAGLNKSLIGAPDSCAHTMMEGCVPTDNSHLVGRSQGSIAESGHEQDGLNIANFDFTAKRDVLDEVQESIGGENLDRNGLEGSQEEMGESMDGVDMLDERQETE